MGGGICVCQVIFVASLVISLCSDICLCNFNETPTQVSTAAPELRKPKLLVFSLDMVIWPFRVETDVVTPVKRHKKTARITDFLKKPLGVYADAVDALNSLYLKKYRLAAISDSPDVETNTKLLLFFNLYNYFPIQEIFGGPKKDHIELIHRITQVPYNEIFYFDRSNSELDAIRKLGVFVIELKDGLEIGEFKKALDRYNEIPTSSNITTNVVP
ncbi:magnesium-dependent phosphatase 1-like [Macrosteles quadrilineatus]|uniref:magnesium-dependent phosphatase 1-like n=1 Tax=Macrosteles quadrilineatus TaxID=74068 RepID=UPI0023E0B2EC|nr:magnesium-dependent phosphatase 1-like [Macrosteles quadrilineatus]